MGLHSGGVSLFCAISAAIAAETPANYEYFVRISIYLHTLRARAGPAVIIANEFIEAREPPDKAWEDSLGNIN